MFWLSDCTNPKKEYDINTNVTWNVSQLYETKNDYDLNTKATWNCGPLYETKKSV